ncbi:hypothetical protein VTK73DRAFT_1654 [Phialemonium thermophilum]|uniref:Uncharacterized protein n=1 Tax=Phialemonium thermophilum TaxID=223376 RepID=A0ABR3VT75_9PEZI
MGRRRLETVLVLEMAAGRSCTKRRLSGPGVVTLGCRSLIWVPVLCILRTNRYIVSTVLAGTCWEAPPIESGMGAAAAFVCVVPSATCVTVSALLFIHLLVCYLDTCILPSHHTCILRALLCVPFVFLIYASCLLSTTCVPTLLPTFLLSPIPPSDVVR